VEETNKSSTSPPKPTKRKNRRASLTSHRKAASAFDLTSSAESLDVVRELRPLMNETVLFSALKAAAREGCLSLCAALSTFVNEENREKILKSMQQKILDLPEEGPDRQKYERVVTVLGKMRKSTRVTIGGSVVGGSITEKAHQQKAQSLTPMARLLLNSWETREGLLSKRGGYIKSWKTRLFFLNKSLLTYHKPLKIAGALSKELGTIDLAYCSIDNFIPNDMEIKKLKLKTPCFALRTPLRTYYLHANTETDRDAWLTAIRINISMARCI